MSQSEAKGSPQEIRLSKKDLLDAFLQLYHTVKNYADLVQESKLEETADPQKLATLLQSHIRSLDYGSVNVQSMELIGTYLKSTLEMFKKDKITFLMPPEPDDDFFNINGDYEGLSKAIEEVESELTDIQEKVYYLTRYAPFSSKEKTRQVLRTIAELFKSIIRKDNEGVLSQVTALHHLTATKESYFLINDIGRVTREIYNSLQEFSDHLPIEELDANLKDQVPDAITKLNMVIKRTEDAANNTLDDVENLLDKNAEEQEKIQTSIQKLTKIEDKIIQLQKDNPEISDDLTSLLTEVKEDIHSNIQSRTETLMAEEAIYIQIMSNQSFQDLTGQTLKKIISFIEGLELNLVEILQKYSGMSKEGEQPVAAVAVEDKADPDEIVLQGPQDVGSPKATSQEDIDKLLANFGF